MTRIPTIVFTGGPCAGKTTALSAASDMLVQHGFQPFIKAEDATALMQAGFSPHNPLFQRIVLERTLQEEALMKKYILKTGAARPVLLCDRGIHDQLGYMEPPAFEALCKEYNIIPTEARDERYTGVIFLRSAAVGAENFYSNASNTTRYESLEEAKKLDQRTLDGWMGATHVHTIRNESGHSFEHKINHALRALARTLGIPEPLEKERKFKLHSFTPSMIPRSAVGIDIVQTYLVSSREGVAERVRARGQHDSWVYFHTTKTPKTAGVSVEVDSIISRHEYDNLLIRRDGRLVSIHKRRWCFEYEGQYCELDVFLGHRKGLVILEIEYDDLETVVVPPYLGPVTDETDNPAYSNYALARAA